MRSDDVARVGANTEIGNGHLHNDFKTKAAIVGALFRRYENALSPCIDAAESIAALDDVCWHDRSC